MTAPSLPSPLIPRAEAERIRKFHHDTTMVADEDFDALFAEREALYKLIERLEFDALVPNGIHEDIAAALSSWRGDS